MIEVDTGALKAALALADSMVARRSTIAILTNVLLTADRQTGLTVTATDLDQWFSRSVPVAADGGGFLAFSCAVDSRTLLSAVSALPAGPVTISISDGKAIVRAEPMLGEPIEYKLNTLDAEDFPKPDDKEWEAEFEIAAADLLQGIDSVSHAISTEETRYYLNGIFIHAKGKTLRLVATDGHRLARWIGLLPEGAKALPDVIVPRRAVALLGKLAKAHKGPIMVQAMARRLVFDVGGSVLITKTLDGRFPDYERVIPKKHPHSLKLCPRAFSAATARAAAVASEKTRAVKAVIGKGALTLSVNSPENGVASATVSADTAGCEAGMEIGFNARYLAETLAHVAADSVSIALGDSATPAHFTAKGSRSDFVLMPMRV